MKKTALVEHLALQALPSQTDSQAIEYLIQTHGEDIFQSLLNTLFNKEFEQEQATELWRQAMYAYGQENNRMSWRAILLDYLLQHTDEVSNPCIIEASSLQQLQHSAVTDGLTSLYNQSHFKHRLSMIINEHQARDGATFALLIFDLDHFKQFNDRCGHLQGDQALVTIGKLICSQIPSGALPARYGGEEFAVILPDTEWNEAISLADQIRATVEHTSFTGEERLDKGKLTISGGVACYPDNGHTSVSLIAHADNNLYQAKETRNNICPRPSNTRRITRHAFRSIVEVLDRATNQPSSSLSADISYTGMLLKTSKACAVGSELHLRFPYPFWPSEHITTGQVRHVRSNEQRGDFLIGIEFLQPQTEFIEKILPTEIYPVSC